MGLTLEQAASKVGCHFATWQKWEKGKVPPHRAIEIEAALGIPRSKLRPDLFTKPETTGVVA